MVVRSVMLCLVHSSWSLSKNSSDLSSFVDWTIRCGAGTIGSWVPSNCLLLKSRIIPLWSEAMLSWNGSYVAAVRLGNRDTEQKAKSIVFVPLLQDRNGGVGLWRWSTASRRPSWRSFGNSFDVVRVSLKSPTRIQRCPWFVISSTNLRRSLSN